MAKQYPERLVYMMDINERALQLAKKNAEINGIQNVRIFKSDGVSNVEKGLQVAAVLTNPPIRAGKDTVFKIYDGAYEVLSSGELVGCDTEETRSTFYSKKIGRDFSISGNCGKKKRLLDCQGEKVKWTSIKY